MLSVNIELYNKNIQIQLKTVFNYDLKLHANIYIVFQTRMRYYKSLKQFKTVKYYNQNTT